MRFALFYLAFISLCARETHGLLDIKIGLITAVHNDEVKNHYDEPDHPIPGHPTDANGHVLVWDSWNDTVNRSYEIVTATPHSEVLDHVTPNFPAKGFTQDLNGQMLTFDVGCNYQEEVFLLIMIFLEDVDEPLVLNYDVACYQPHPANCSQLNFCNGHGYCDNTTVTCYCDEWYFGASCTGHYNFGPIADVRNGSYYTCPGEHVFHITYAVEEKAHLDDHLLVLTEEELDASSLTEVYDVAYLQSVYQDGYVPVREKPARNVTFYRAYSHEGEMYVTLEPVAYFDAFTFTVLHYSDPLCSDVVILTNCTHNCSNAGECINGTCHCEEGFWGDECEYGCAPDTNVSGFGGVITDGSKEQASPLGTNCVWHIHSDYIDGTGIEVNFRDFNANQFTSLRFYHHGHKIQEFTNYHTAVSFTTTHTDLKVVWHTYEGYVSGGFEFEWATLGCPPGNYIHSLSDEEWLPESMSHYALNVQCGECPVGHFNPSYDAHDCLPCTPGHYANTSGMAECATCPNGYHQSHTGWGACVACPPGKHTMGPGMADCVECDPGTMAPTAGMDECWRCPIGTYQSEAGSRECLACPENTTTLSEMSLTIDACVCIEGHFNKDSAVGVACSECPIGGVCKGHTTPAVPADGYWASEEDPFYIMECVNPEACPKGECAPHHIGQLCSDCEQGYFLDSGMLCSKCSKGNILATPFLLSGLLICVYVSYQVANSHRDDNMYSTLGMGTSFGLWLNYVQFSSLFGSFGVGWPTPVRALLNVFSFSILQLGIFSPTCSMPMDYETQLILRNFAPIFLIVLIMLTHVFYPLHYHFVNWIKPRARSWYPDIADAVIKGVYIDGSTSYKEWIRRYFISHVYRTFLKHEPMSWRRSVNAILMILEVVYIFMVANVFELFDCFRQADGRQVLVADPGIFCYEARWYRLLPGIVVFGVLYCLVIPGVVAHALWSVHKSAGEYTRVPQNLWETYSAILYRFKREYRFWAFVVIVRKIVVSLAISSFSSYPVVQGTAAIVTLFVAFWIQLQWRPYRLNIHNNLETVLLGLNIILVLFGLLFYIDEWPFALETAAVVACIILTVSGSLYTMYVLGWSFFQLLVEIKADHMNKEDTHALLFERRHIAYDSSTSVLLTNLDIDYTSLYQFMSFAHDDDIVRLAHIASTLERLEFIRMQKSASTLPHDNGSVKDALKALWGDKLSTVAGSEKGRLSRPGSARSRHSAHSLPVGDCELTSLPTYVPPKSVASMLAPTSGGSIPVDSGMSLDVLEAQLQAEARAIVASGGSEPSLVELASAVTTFTGSKGARALNNTNMPGVLTSVSGTNLAAKMPRDPFVDSESGSGSGSEFSHSSAPGRTTTTATTTTDATGATATTATGFTLTSATRSPQLDIGKVYAKKKEEREKRRAVAAAANAAAGVGPGTTTTTTTKSPRGGSKTKTPRGGSRTPRGASKSPRGQGDGSTAGRSAATGDLSYSATSAGDSDSGGLRRHASSKGSVSSRGRRYIARSGTNGSGVSMGDMTVGGGSRSTAGTSRSMSRPQSVAQLISPRSSVGGGDVGGGAGVVGVGIGRRESSKSGVGVGGGGGGGLMSPTSPASLESSFMLDSTQQTASPVTPHAKPPHHARTRSNFTNNTISDTNTNTDTDSDSYESLSTTASSRVDSSSRRDFNRSDTFSSLGAPGSIPLTRARALGVDGVGHVASMDAIPAPVSARGEHALARTDTDFNSARR